MKNFGSYRDQLNSEHSWFKQIDHDTIYVLAEMRQETDYVKHHIQKWSFFPFDA
jgi:deoxyribodipyrimidine photolyase-like uncharacterized protein